MFMDAANCIPVWYKVGGYVRDVNIFIEFYGEDGSTEGTTATDTCLAFECPSCHDQSNSECVQHISCVSCDPDHTIKTYTGTTPTSRCPSRPSCLRMGHPFGSLLLPSTLGQRPFGLGTMHQIPTTERIYKLEKVDVCP